MVIHKACQKRLKHAETRSLPAMSATSGRLVDARGGSRANTPTISCDHGRILVRSATLCTRLVTIPPMNVLVSWVGQTDLDAAAGDAKAGIGPIGQALTKRAYDLVVLLNNYPEARC